jgi:hypothetical protein
MRLTVVVQSGRIAKEPVYVNSCIHHAVAEFYDYFRPGEVHHGGTEGTEAIADCGLRTLGRGITRPCKQRTQSRLPMDT